MSLSVIAGTATAGSIDAIYSFGDSLSDVGNAFIATGFTIPGPPYVNGQFSNGPIWVQTLAADLGLPPLTPSLAGGTDYAVGTAESGTTLFHTAGPADLPSQLASFETGHSAADPNALYTIWIGSNDLGDIPNTANTAQIGADFAEIVGNIDSSINTLAGLGATNFLVLTVPDVGKTPAALAGGPLAAAAASALSGQLDTALAANLAGFSGLNLRLLNTYALVDAIVANPGVFGFTNVTAPCVTGAVNFVGGTACSADINVQNQFLFWDQQHPTEAGHALVGNAALAILTPEPASLSLLTAGLVALGMIRLRSSR